MGKDGRARLAYSEPSSLVRSRRGLDVKDIELLVLRHELEILLRRCGSSLSCAGLWGRSFKSRERALNAFDECLPVVLACGWGRSGGWDACEGEIWFESLHECADVACEDVGREPVERSVL